MNSAGGFPNQNGDCVRSNRARATPTSMACARVVSSWVFGLLDLHVGGNATGIAALDQCQGLFILSHGRIQKLFLGIEETGLKIIQG